jgi:hypothetical protein
VAARSKEERFRIRFADVDEPQPKLESPGAVLSKALTRALAATEPGMWEVWEYDDLVYRVHRAKESTFTITVERM